MTNLKKRIVVLVSGGGSNLQAIIDECAANNINAQVVGVISNVPNVYALKRCAVHEIPNLVVDHKAFPDRNAFDASLAKEIHHFRPDLIVLAGFMRILSASFVSQFSGKMLNIHPSLLPKYPGLHTHKKVVENKDIYHGSSVHFVSPELDGGPVILQSIINVHAQDTVQLLQDRISETEWLIYPLAIKWFCQGALRINQDKVWFSNNLDLSLLRDDVSVGCKIKINNNQGFYNNDEEKQ